MNDSILAPDVIDIQPRIVRRELNLDFGQFFYPQEKRKVFVSRIFVSDLGDSEGNQRIIRAKVSYHPDYGTLTTFDERVFYVLVELWQEQGKAETVYFSEREIARRLNIQWAGDSARRISKSLTRLRLVGIEWDGSFFHKPSNRLISISNPFTILSHLKTLSTKDEGIGSQIAEFRFDERVIQNLNSKYSRPVLLDTVLSFHIPLAQALYTYLEPRMYPTNHFHRTSAGLLIDDLGLIGSSYKRRANRVQYIKRAKDELIGKPFYYGEAITKVEIANGKEDAIFHSYRSGASGMKGQLVEIPHIATKRSAPTDTPKEQKPQNRQETSSDAEGDAEGDVTPKRTTKTPSRASEAAYELLQCFASVFYADEQHEFDKNDVLLSEKIVKEHGLDKAKYFVRFAHAEAKQSNYKIKYFRGAKKYLKPAIESFERERRIAKRYQDEIDQRNLAHAQIDHEREYWGVYEEFVNERIEFIIDNHPKRFDEFRKLQAQERLTVQEKFADKPKMQKQMLEFFDKPSQAILRIVKHFKGDTKLHIPDFQEWDKEHNPNSFGK